MELYDYTVNRPDGTETSLKTYEGKVLLVVNTATHCGFTPQYEGLEKLYQSFKNKGFEILDFPCNQFANQTPENDDEIGKICELTYHTTFPRFSKVKVNGKQAHPFFKYLKKQGPVEYGENLKREGRIFRLLFQQRIKWNFTKFLINQKGEIVERFGPKVKPEAISHYIEALL